MITTLYMHRDAPELALASGPMSAARSVHPRAMIGGRHDYGLEMASEATPIYHRWIASRCVPYLGTSVLEVGAGHGAVTHYLALDRRVVALDASPDCVAALQQRFRGCENVTVVRGDARQLETAEQFDSIVMINVLEHIFDDTGILASLSRHLNPDGTMIIYVPALDILYTKLDRQIGHFRRYTKRRLAAVVREAGLRLIEQRYANMLAIAPWVLSGWVGRSGAAHSQSLAAWDRIGTRLGIAIESHVNPPIGLNLFAVAERSNW